MISLCRGCYEDLPHLINPCMRCALPLPATELAPLCGQCLTDHDKPIDLTIAPLSYQFPVDYTIGRFKFHGELPFGRSFAQLLIDNVIRQQNTTHYQLPDVLFPMPLHPLRQKERGFNQAEYLAHKVGHQLKIPTDIDSCYRTKHTPPQSSLSKTARQKNLKDCFDFDAKSAVPKCAAIVDDVITTGASVRALSKVLKAAGVHTVQVWALARTPL